MEKERFRYLYKQYQSNLLSVQERQEWEVFLVNKEIADELEQDIPWFDIPTEDLFGLSEVRANSMISEIVKQPQVSHGGRSYKFWYVAAAVVTIIVSIGIGFFTKRNLAEETKMTYMQDVLPGGLGATLTLANGKKISLNEASKGELTTESGVVISKAENGQLVYEIKVQNGGGNEVNTLSTANGETYQVRLPDGTVVVLNAASSLTYAVNLNEHKKRIVNLTGEAYFEVAEDKERPFIVKTHQQEVTVLGTHFNINAYKDENVTKTTLLEGSVKVNGSIIKPGQQSIIKDIDIQIINADIEMETAWKNGYFIFNDESLESIMRKISRWYDVEVFYQDKLPPISFIGEISRSKNLSTFIGILEESGDVHFKIQGRRIIVTK